MKIDKLTQDTILVTLTGDDMGRYALDFDSADEATRSGLKRLICRIGEECGLSHKDKSYLIEALAGKDSCLLIISAHPVKKRKTYRVKRERRLECCRFESADGLLGFMAQASDLIYTLYSHGGGYVLLPCLPLSPRQRGLLNEYGAVREISAVAAERVREYGTEILSRSGRQNKSLKLTRIAARYAAGE